MIEGALVLYAAIAVLIFAVCSVDMEIGDRRMSESVGRVLFALAWPVVTPYAFMSVLVDEIAARRRRAKDRARRR